jgi:alkylation response protein AidB-like acyl-CoA dehydrogenase
MDLNITPEGEAFRQKVRAWLKERLPDYWPLMSRLETLDGPRNDEELAMARRWQGEAHAAGFVAPNWPKKYGGQDMDPMLEMVLREEMVRAGAPLLVGTSGLEMLGPTLIKWGTEDQKLRYLPKILTAEELWCQGFSEPSSGSDLASLRTRAELEGDHFVVNGQKVWTSNAHHSDMMFGLVRTDPQAPKHQGISFLLIDMRSPGITVRPLIQMTGRHGFNEVFFDQVTVPRENLVGGLNEGWRIAVDTLLNERAMIASSTSTELLFNRLLNLARTFRHDGRPLTNEPRWRQQLAEFDIRLEATRLHHYRQLSNHIAGRRDGPEIFINKLVGTQLTHDIATAAMDILGDYGLLAEGEESAPDDGFWPGEWLLSLGLCIGGGTTQIHKNTIAERALRMPRSR